MAFLINEHVNRLWQYQPFHPDFSQLYAECVDTRHSDQISTRALEFVAQAVVRPTARLVVLTGDPGHGKTHLCGQLITRLEPGTSDVRNVLKEFGDGTAPVARLPAGKALHLIKDLTEWTEVVAAQRLREALADEQRVTVVCANEGRLRHVVSLDPTGLGAIQAALERVLASGRTTADDVVWVVNLNHQSVAAEGGRSLVLQALRNWAGDDRKWSRTCDDCAAKSACPIYENHRLLGADDEAGGKRRAGLEMLLRVAEKTGHIVPIRDLLVLLAHTITGGLRCSDVHRQVQHSRSPWQWQHMYFQVAFGHRLEARDIERLPVFRAMRLLDPGLRAIRPVDDDLDVDTADDQGRFLPPLGEGGAPPRSRNQHRAAANSRRQVYEFLRRRDYFAAPRSGGGTVAFSERLGFRHYGDFEKLLEPRVQQTETVDVRNTVLCGIEALQGVCRAPGHGSFAVVDSAFSSHRGGASVAAYQVPKMRIQLLSQTGWWRLKRGTEPDIAKAVDWVDRTVHIVIPDADGATWAVDLDCRQFELVCRAAHGLVSRAFFQADIRRVVGQLAPIGANAPRADEITVIVNGSPSKLVIDIGDVIVASGA